MARAETSSNGCDLGLLLLDAMNDASLWRAVAPNGTPSGELSAASDGAVYQPVGEDRASLRVEATVGAIGHQIRRSMAAVDLSGFDEVRLWYQASRPADGSPGQPFCWRLKVGGPALAIDDAGNTWSRYVPTSQANTWELVRFSLGDLPSALRPAVTQFRFELVDASQPLTCRLDALGAVREQMVLDVEDALIAALDRRVDAGLPAVLVNPDDAVATPLPSIQVRPYDIERADDRADYGASRVDYTDAGFRLRPAGVPYDLYYVVDVRTPDRVQRATAIEYVLRRFSPRGDLAVNGTLLTAEIVARPALPDDPSLYTGRTPLRLRIAAWQQVAPAVPATQPKQVIVETDSLARRS